MRTPAPPVLLRIFVFAAIAMAIAIAVSVGWDGADKPRRPLPLEPIFSGADFQSRRLDNVQWSEDGTRFTFTREEPATRRPAIYEYAVASGDERVFLSSEKLVHRGKPVVMTGYERVAGGRYLLINGPRERTWDSVIQGPHYVYDTEQGTLSAVAEGNATLRNVHLSPDGHRVGYVLDNNLYLVDLRGGRTSAVTTDGSANIFNAIFDKGSTEFGFRDAWYFSPDGKKLAYWRLDVTDVKVWYMVDELGKYPVVHPMKYPNTAEKHAVNHIGVYDLGSGKTVWMDIGDNPDDYIPRIDWTPSSDTLAIQRLARNHHRLDLLLADTSSGASRIVVTDRDPAWVEVTRDLTFLKDGRHFVWTSEKSGYRHAYRYDYDGNEVQLTHGDWEISSLAAVDEANGWLYFYAKKDGLINQHVYRVPLDGGAVTRLTREDGWYEWDVAPGGGHVIQTWSSITTPPRVTLRESASDTFRTLIENDLPGLKKYEVPHPEFLTFKTSDGITLNAYMIKPPDFDPSKRYPVITYGYGNAGTQEVVNRWGTARGAQRDLFMRHMAAHGYILWCLDNRTSAGRGKKAYNLTYGEYGKWAIHDEIEGARYLRSLSYVDPERLGFWGWSGGGYLAAALMTKGAPNFQVGVAGAPVINLENYQAVGVERWMNQLKANPEGYARVNLTNYADRLEGDLLLIHGTGDDNTKWASTLQFADALIKAGKQFDLMVYPNEHHNLESYQQHLYTKIENYFKEKL
ncbi:MAG: DPP IV N-terminal domain-containing protein [Gammaproteobacteria bacterium]